MGKGLDPTKIIDLWPMGLTVSELNLFQNESLDPSVESATLGELGGNHLDFDGFHKIFWTNI